MLTQKAVVDIDREPLAFDLPLCCVKYKIMSCVAKGVSRQPLHEDTLSTQYLLIDKGLTKFQMQFRMLAIGLV